MEKKLFLLERMTIKEFAEEHNLVMEIHERTHIDGPERLYAHFEDAEIKEGNCLVGNFGNGSTEEDAINNYAKEISGKRLVIGAYKNRREIIVPILIGETTNGKEKGQIFKV